MKKKLTAKHAEYVIWAFCIAFIVFALANLLIFMSNNHSTICDQTIEFNPITGQITFYNVYRDGHTETIATFDQSSAQAQNPLCDPLYSGKAPEATGCNPRELYASDHLFGSFEYGRGRQYHESYTISRDEKNGLMIVEFENGIVSWVNADGVIVSAQIVYGYDFDDSEFYVAFYDK